MEHNRVILKKGKEFPIKNRHHWIFSGAVQSFPEYNNGDILEVQSYSGEFLGHAYFNKITSISGRMLNFDKTPPLDSVKINIQNAVKLRNKIFKDDVTNCYRVINSEGDYIPGLIVDKYNDVLVIQINTLGISLIRDVIVNCLLENYGERISSIYEKSNSNARKQDGIKPFEGHIYGDKKQNIKVLENGIPFMVDVVNGQKTGLFLDMREMRKLVMEHSAGKSVLNCFSYSGGFSVYASKGGATKTTSVDISKEAIAQAKNNFEMNKMDLNKNQLVVADVFEYLKANDLNYDIVILDPPAFAKKKSDIYNAKKGYMEINRDALSKMPRGSSLLTSSCSYYIDEQTFKDIVYSSARAAGRSLKLISKHRLAPDHPINTHHKESIYIKSLFLTVL